jgi:hypothetical protein
MLNRAKASGENNGIRGLEGGRLVRRKGCREGKG